MEENRLYLPPIPSFKIRRFDDDYNIYLEGFHGISSYYEHSDKKKQKMWGASRNREPTIIESASRSKHRIPLKEIEEFQLKENL